MKKIIVIVACTLVSTLAFAGTAAPTQAQIQRDAYCSEFVDVLIIATGGRRANYSPQQMLKIVNRGAYPRLTEKDKKQAINAGYFGANGYEASATDIQFRGEMTALCNNHWNQLGNYQPLK